MKKILPVYLLFTACALSAQTTCEMRVDAHQGASTMQRVDYCLNAPVEPGPMDNAEVIYYGVVDTQGKEQAQDDKATAKDGYYSSEQVKVSRGYMGTRKFPAFTNDTLSESERAYQRRHLQEAKDEIAAKNAAKIAAARQAEQQKAAALVAKAQPAQEVPVQVVKEVKEEKVVVASAETKKGLLKRQKKPARRDNVVVIPEAIPVTSEHMEMATEEAVYQLDQPAYASQEVSYPMTDAVPAANNEPSQIPSAYNEPTQIPSAYSEPQTPSEPVKIPSAYSEPVKIPSAYSEPQPQPNNTPDYNPYYESGVAVSAPVTYDQISQK